MSEAIKETTRTDWNERNKLFFVHAMMNEAARGNFVGNGYKKSSWQAIADEFRLKSGCKYDKSQLHSHYAVLKKKYYIYKALQDDSADSASIPIPADRRLLLKFGAPTSRHIPMLPNSDTNLSRFSTSWIAFSVTHVLTI
jgi:Myb/SANT-like DNA-binding domain